MRKVLILVAATAMFGAGVASAQSPPPKGQVGIRLLDAPVGRENDPRAHLYIIDHLSQGATIHRRIEVSNGLDHAAHISLYAAGAQVSDGSFQFFDGRKPDELSTWTTTAPTSVDIASGGTAISTVTIAVPSGVTDGERYAVVWAELPSSTSPSGVKTVNRVGIRIYLSVGNGAEPTSDFVVDSLTASRDASGRPQVSASVRNTGKRALDMSGELRLTNGPGGLAAGPFGVKLGTTLGIGASEPVTVLLDPAIPDGPWDAKLVLRSGLIAREATGRIIFPSGRSQTSSPVPAKTRKLPTPLQTTRGRIAVFGAGFLVVLLFGVIFLLWRRRRGEDEDDKRKN